jgi:hypothetical protein
LFPRRWIVRATRIERISAPTWGKKRWRRSVLEGIGMTPSRTKSQTARGSIASASSDVTNVLDVALGTRIGKISAHTATGDQPRSRASTGHGREFTRAASAAAPTIL